MSQVNDNKLNCIYLLYGEDKYLLESSLKKIKKTFGDCFRGINYVQIDETNVNSLIPELDTPAFGYDKKLIIVKAELLKKRKKRNARRRKRK